MPRDERSTASRPTPLGHRALYSHISTHATQASALTALQLVDEFRYIIKHNNGPRSKATVYQCTGHLRFTRLLRIRHVEWTMTWMPDQYLLEGMGEHAEDSTNSSRRGVHPAFKQEIDAAALAVRPQVILKKLRAKYQGQPKLFAELPTCAQIKARKNTLLKNRSHPFEIAVIADLYEWVAPRMCTSASVFFDGRSYDRATDEATFTCLPEGFRNDLLVLKCFQHTYEDGGCEKLSVGLVVTTRRLFRNVVYATDGQQDDGVLAAVDSTHNLYFGHWVLAPVGSYRHRYTSNRAYEKEFVPWAYLFAFSEDDFVYEQLFRTVAKCTDIFFNTELKIRYGCSLDNSAYIAQAFRAVWADVTMIGSYPHAAQQCQQRKPLLKNKRYLSTVMVHVKQMSEARSPQQFEAIVGLCLRHWRRDNEGVYADWFENEWLSDGSFTWYSTSGTPGILPSQIPLDIKSYGAVRVGTLREKTNISAVLNASVPSVLALASADAPTGPYAHYYEGPILSEMIEEAAQHTRSEAYYTKTSTENGHFQSIFFNAPAYVASKTSDQCINVTRDRVNRFLETKEGTLRDAATTDDATLHCLSLHEVKIIGSLDQLALLTLENKVTVSVAKIQAIRALYQCDCEFFWSNGWLCAHVIATAALMKQFNLEGTTGAKPTTARNGGQRYTLAPTS